MWQGGRWEEISHFNQMDRFGGREGKMREKKKKGKEKKEEGKWSEKLYLFSKIYGDRVVGFHRSKRQSSSTRRKSEVFAKLQEVGVFSPTLVILNLRSI